MEAVFLKLVNMSLTASWLVLAVLLLRLVLKDVPKYIRVLLWGIVGLRLVFPFSLESMFSLIPSAEPLPQEFLYAATPQVNTGIPAINSAINPIIAESLTPTTMANSANPTQIWSFILSQIWIVGMVLMLGYALVSYLLVRRKVAASIKIGKNLRICDHLDSPFILGIFRPVIYLPSELDQKTADLVLAHEYAHLKRRDHWWKPLGFALLCVYWFNPVMWVAYILLCRDIELACDEKVIRELGTDEKKAYSAALLHCSVPRKLIAACPLAFGEVGVKDRIKSVLNYKKPAFWIILIAVIVCIVFAVCFLTDPVEKVDPLTLENWGITITAEDPSPTGVTLAYHIPDNLDGEVTIPINQTLLRLEDENWVEVLTVIEDDGTPNWIKWLFADQNAAYQKLEWVSVCGSLAPGQYRICKTLWLHQDGVSYQKEFFTEFTVSEQSEHSPGETSEEWMQEVTDALDNLRSLEYYHIQAQWEFSGENVLSGQSFIEYWKYPDAMLKLAYIPDDNSTTAHLWVDGSEELKSITYDGSIDWSTGHFLEDGIPQPWFFSFYPDREDARAISCQHHQDGYTIRLLVNYPAIGETLYAPGSYHADFRFDNSGTLKSISVVSESEASSEYGTFEILPTPGEQISDTIWSYLTMPEEQMYPYLRPVPGQYIPAECLYMNPLSSYHYVVGDVPFTLEIGSDCKILSPSGSVMEQIEAVNWGWQNLNESGEDLTFMLRLLEHEGRLNLTEDVLYQKLSDEYHLLSDENGLILVQSHNGESVWSVYRLISVDAENAIVEQFSDTVVQSWQNSRDNSKSVVYLNPDTGEYYDSSTKLDHLIRQTILRENELTDSTSGVWLESHEVLGEVVACGLTSDGQTIGLSTFYVLAQVSEVTSEGGELQVLSSRTFPVIIHVTENADREMTVTDYWQAEDGADPEEAIRANFPSAVLDSMELTTRQHSHMLELLIQIQARYYFGIYPWTVVGDLFEDLAQNQPPITMNLDLDGQRYQTHEAWNALNHVQFSRGLCDFSFEEITEAEAWKRDNSTGIVFRDTETHLSVTFYEGTNDIRVWSNNDIHYYRATYLYDENILISDLVRSWFDEAEYYDLLNQWVLQTSMVPNYGQDYLTAAQEFSQRYEDVKLKTNPGSAYRYSFVKCEVEENMDATNLARSRGELDDNGYAFWVTVYFVPENDRAMRQSMAGNTDKYTGSDPDIPAGAYVYTRCGYITQTEYGWVGEIVGTSW